MLDESPTLAAQPLSAEARDWRSAVLEVRRSRERDLAFYSRIARVYELWAVLTERRARRAVIERAALCDGESVLEVATGTGVQLLALARANLHGRTVGVDLADGMLATTRARLAAGGRGAVEVHRADALCLPFPDESFDLVINSFMLDLLPREEIPRALSELARVLRPGGRLVLSNMTKGERPSHRVWDAFYARGLSLTANCRGVLAAPVLREIGFTDVERDYVSQMLVPIEVVVARKPAQIRSDGMDYIVREPRLRLRSHP
jgi:ubiquinone/menaquinone biosynthesis C-methylase UbiE